MTELLSHLDLHSIIKGLEKFISCRLNSVLKQLKYPVVPQLYLDQKVLEEAFGKEENDALNQRSPEEKNTQVDRDSKDDESLEADTEESEEMSESRYKLMSQIEAWARENDIFKELQAYIIKPALGSYSENVISVLSLEEALEVLEALFSQARFLQQRFPYSLSLPSHLFILYP